MQKYGIAVEQLTGQGQAAAQAAERIGARTIIYREKTPIAAVVPLGDLLQLEPDPGENGDDPLLSLCGTCSSDRFVDRLSGGTTASAKVPPRP
jgi:hypothetical protein